jgi:hypothetical protein
MKTAGKGWSGSSFASLMAVCVTISFSRKAKCVLQAVGCGGRNAAVDVL